MPPDARIVALLGRARRRMLTIECATLLTVAALAGTVWVLARWKTASATEMAAAPAALIAIALAIAYARASRRSPEGIIEARTGEFRNALVTSAQILRGELRTTPGIRELVLADTSARIERIDLAAILPARRQVGSAAVALVVLGGAVAFGITRPHAAVDYLNLGTRAEGSMSIRGIEITITPPAYSGLPTVKLENPERLEAFEGSRVAVRMFAGRDVEDAGLTATNQTFIELTPKIAPGERILIPMSVTPDRAPVVRVAEPGRDLFLASSRHVPVRVAAQDDLGIVSLTLAYTKVSGSGETFRFVEGTLPLALTRANAREIAGAAVIDPAALGLATGDMLVYRAIARDANPRRAPVESDAFVIELVSASEAMAEGFSIDDQRDKYALSQQMVILKTERLIAKRRGMTAEAIAEEAAMIAAEQRQVRAEFVFMMGGEVEDEEVEAEHSHELAEGREQNEGRRDLIGAIRAMSDAAALLMKPLVDDALISEKRALLLLQRALTRSRYILRVLSTRERIDDARRLTGDRTGAPGWRREFTPPAASREVQALRTALVALSGMARRESYGDAERRALLDLARLLLTIPDPRAREAAEAVNGAARTRDARAAASHLDRAALAVDAALEAHAAATSTPPAPIADKVRGALLDHLRAPRAAGGGR